MDTTGWYVTWQGKIQGPLPWEKLQELAQSGRLKPEMGLSQDKASWVPARSMPGLFDMPSDDILGVRELPAPLATCTIGAPRTRGTPRVLGPGPDSADRRRQLFVWAVLVEACLLFIWLAGVALFVPKHYWDDAPFWVAFVLANLPAATLLAYRSAKYPPPERTMEERAASPGLQAPKPGTAMGCLTACLALVCVSSFVTALSGKETRVEPIGVITRGWLRAAVEGKPQTEMIYGSVKHRLSHGERIGNAFVGVIFGAAAIFLWLRRSQRMRAPAAPR